MEMSDRIIKLGLMGMASIIILAYFTISTAFIIILLGFLMFLPVLAIALVLKEGIPIISQQIHDLLASSENSFLISFSRENIILEPQFR